MEADLDLPMCVTCGTQFEPADGKTPANCHICDDPRQFVPGTGQAWTTLREVQKTHKNHFEQDKVDPNLTFIVTEPKFAIGERCCFIQTPHGNVLWDLISLVDDTTVEYINSRGGLKAIVISHPHYYSTYVTWSKAFSCPVYTSVEDKMWFSRDPSRGNHKFLEDNNQGNTREIIPGITAIRAGGHFDGSLLLHMENKLFIADTIVTVPSAYKPDPRPPGQTTFAFLWSIPNSIPLPPDEVLKVWRATKPFSFDTTHGAFWGMDIRDKRLKARMLESMQIFVRTGGCDLNHALLKETSE